jgi:hypothetical protein
VSNAIRCREAVFNDGSLVWQKDRWVGVVVSDVGSQAAIAEKQLKRISRR